jgi:hypothetical protein
VEKGRMRNNNNKQDEEHGRGNRRRSGVVVKTPSGRIRGRKRVYDFAGR